MRRSRPVASNLPATNVEFPTSAAGPTTDNSPIYDMPVMGESAGGSGMIKTSPNERPACPECAMGMIVIKGFGFDRDVQTLECLRCEHIELPTSIRPQARLKRF
jgi:hypothetical protein